MAELADTQLSAAVRALHALAALELSPEALAPVHLAYRDLVRPEAPAGPIVAQVRDGKSSKDAILALQADKASKQLQIDRAAAKAQQDATAVLEAQNRMEDAEAEASRLRIERDSLQKLCEETHSKKEEYKTRLLGASEYEQKLIHELDFGLKDGSGLRAEVRKLEQQLAEQRVMPAKIEKDLGSQIQKIGAELTESKLAYAELEAKLLQEQALRKAMRTELGTALRDAQYLRKEREEVASKIPGLEAQVATVKQSQKALLDEHVPLSTTHPYQNKQIPMVLSSRSALQANVGAHSLREFPGLVSPNRNALKNY